MRFELGCYKIVLVISKDLQTNAILLKKMLVTIAVCNRGQNPKIGGWSVLTSAVDNNINRLLNFSEGGKIFPYLLSLCNQSNSVFCVN